MSVITREAAILACVAGNFLYDSTFVNLIDSVHFLNDPAITKGNASIKNDEIKVGTVTMTSTGFTAGTNSLTATALNLGVKQVQVNGRNGMLAEPQAGPSKPNINSYSGDFTERQLQCLTAMFNYTTAVLAILITHNLAYDSSFEG